LINSINNKHQKLDKKIIGSDSWTTVVGRLLKELKEQDEDSNLNFKEIVFNYSTQEHDFLLELIQQGQKLYTRYLPIKSTSFINPKKLVGDNPYIIEQKINEDFNIYTTQIEEIKQLLEASKNEYITLRKSELNTQIFAINNIIGKILTKEGDLNNLLLISYEKYFNTKKAQFTKQIEIINHIIKEIETILTNNQHNLDFKNEEKINTISYKLLSFFSKQKEETIADYHLLQSGFLRLENCLKDIEELQHINFNGTVFEKNNTLKKIKYDIEKIKNEFDRKIKNEFSKYDLDLILNKKNNHFYEFFEIAKNETVEVQNILLLIKTDFETYISEITTLFQILERELFDKKDFKLKYKLDNSFVNNKNILLEIKLKINEIRKNFDIKVHNEFQAINLLKANKDTFNINSLAILQERIYHLAFKFNSDNWLPVKLNTTAINSFIDTLELYIKSKNEYFNSKDDLFTIEFKWFQFYNNLSEKEKIIIDELKPKNDWRKTFLIFYLNSLLISSASIELPTNDEEHKEFNYTLSKIEREQLKFIKEFWFSKQIDETKIFEQNNNGLSVENLYNKRSSRNFKKLSLRQIVQKDANLFSTFFPIILTSPDVASNLFKGMNNFFDIVMFDEASQLRLEDTLPAILKGKQIIIAGDEHQMPPSNYFSKVFDGLIEDEDDIEEESNAQTKIDKDDILLDCESLIDFGAQLNFQKKFLDFHYRSRHPFLIDFSNYAFYNQRLKPIPNNFDYIPIKYIQVNGTFSDHTNEAEAEMVLSIIDKNINRFPNGEYPTVGIASFNIAQRNLIKSKILQRQKFSKYEEFNAKVQELEEKGMFVKNLENIQGDERDVIILSTTYGINKDGKFAQRFGPINHSKGYKLLNVIITRAKYKIYCCSSIPEDIFMGYKNYLEDEGSNNKRSVIYAYLAYCKAVSEADNGSRLAVLSALAENTSNSVGLNPRDFGELESPFEEEVYQALVDNIGTENLTTQLQFAGFRIDIVYNSNVKGIPKIAIECDGAKYHSSREAYLYDKHRQNILENHGFVFHRIWSTNWWRNPKKETERLVSFIKQVETTYNSNQKDYSQTANAFTDDVDIIEEYINKNNFATFDEDRQNIQILKKVNSDTNEVNILLNHIVKLNSKVHVRYLNNEKDISVQLVSTENNKLIPNEIQKIYEKSPLAVSLLGHTVGDIVKIGNLDNYVEIIKIEN